MNRVKYKIYFVEKQGPMLENGMGLSFRRVVDSDKYSFRHEVKLSGIKYPRPQVEGIVCFSDRELSVIMAGGTIIF